MIGLVNPSQPKEGQCSSALVGAFGSDAVTRRPEGWGEVRGDRE